MGLFRRSSRSHFRLTLVAVLAVAISSAQNASTVCQAVRDAIYATDYEREHDPCNACTYDTSSRRLSVECRYSYCESCDKASGYCGVRVIEINQTLTDNSIAAFLEQRAKLDTGSTKRYCIDYSDGGAFSSKVTCIDIADSFNTDCNAQFQNLPYGLPLLTCDQTQGCQCAVSGGKSDKTSPFIGFEKLNFDRCYVESTSSVARRRLHATIAVLMPATLFFFVL